MSNLAINAFLDTILQIFTLALFIKTTIAPYFIKKRSKVTDIYSLSEHDTRVYYRKKRGKVNESYIVTFTVYFFLLIWLFFPKINAIFSSFGNINKYIGTLLETAFFVMLQELFYKYSISQKIDTGNSIYLLSIQKRKNEILVKDIYIILITLVLLQASVIGLIPFVQVDNYIFIDIFCIAIVTLSFVNLLFISLTVRKYNKQKKYFLNWTVFTFVTVFKSIILAILTYYNEFFEFFYNRQAIITGAVLNAALCAMTIIQVVCLFLNLTQTKSMDVWYD